MTARRQLLELLEELGAIHGVKGALVATSEGAVADGQHSGLTAPTANDIAKTVRRMAVASATVGVPLQELLINFGAARMMITPVTEDATIVVLLERDQAVTSVRAMLAVQLEDMRELLALQDDESEGDSGRDDVDALMRSELGPVIERIQSQFSTHFMRTGGASGEAEKLVQEQLREWLLCCNPSPYTIPLFLDGLSQLLNDFPAERGAFMQVVQTTLQNVEIGAGEGVQQ